MKIRVLFVIIFVTTFMAAWGRSFSEGSDAFRPYGFNRTFDWGTLRLRCGDGINYLDSLKKSLENRKSSYLICPWWLEDLYSKNVKEAHYQDGIGYVGYTLDDAPGGPGLINEWKNSIGAIWDSLSYNVPYDLVVYCRNGDVLDRFLCSEPARLYFLNQVFGWPNGLINQKHQGRKPRGINFYFPELSFREKKEFVQFMRSVNRVINMFCLQGDSLIYKGYTFSITLPAKMADKKDYLSSVVTFADCIYFVDYDEFGVPVAWAGKLNKHNALTPFTTKLVNRCYLVNWNTIPGNACSNDMSALARMDASIFPWKLYLFIDAMLILLLIVLIALYHLWDLFYTFINCLHWFAIPVFWGLTVCVPIFFYYAWEALSTDVILLDMSTGSHWWLLALPILLVLVCVIVNLTRGHGKLP